MATLIEDIGKSSTWIVEAFKEDKFNLDYSINSFIDIDVFFNKHSFNGKAVRGGRLSKKMGSVMFAIGSYIGESIIKNVPGAVWVTDDNDKKGEINIYVQLPGGGLVWPVQRVMKRFANGIEDSVYVYGHTIVKDFVELEFEGSFWEKTKVEKKEWWKFW